MENMELYDSFVCPTYVGMNRWHGYGKRWLLGMPHVCGDEPLAYGIANAMAEYAPRMWG